MWHVYNLISDVRRSHPPSSHTPLTMLTSGRRSPSPRPSTSPDRLLHRLFRFLSGPSQPHPLSHQGLYVISLTKLSLIWQGG